MRSCLGQICSASAWSGCCVALLSSPRRIERRLRSEAGARRCRIIRVRPKSDWWGRHTHQGLVCLWSTYLLSIFCQSVVTCTLRRSKRWETTESSMFYTHIIECECWYTSRVNCPCRRTSVQDWPAYQMTTSLQQLKKYFAIKVVPPPVEPRVVACECKRENLWFATMTYQISNIHHRLRKLSWRVERKNKGFVDFDQEIYSSGRNRWILQLTLMSLVATKANDRFFP